jgi:hypothetical protein
MSRLKWYALLAIGIMFTIGGAAMVITGAEHGWVVLLFFGMCTAVFIGELWPGRLLRKSAPPDTLLQRFPGPVELSVDRPKFLFLLIGAAIFGGVSVWVLQYEPLGWFETGVLWLCVIGCVAAIPLMIALMLQGSSLRLDNEGLQVKYAWRTHRARWADTSVFEVSALPVSGADVKMIIFDDAKSRSSMLGGISARMVGRSGGLPDTYGLSHEELAWLLNRWRERALSAEGEPQGNGATP